MMIPRLENIERQPTFWYGDRFFMVRPCIGYRESVTAEFREKCPVCDDTRKIRVRGFEFDCPNCCRYSRQQTKEYLRLMKYEVKDFIVNEIKIKGPDTKSGFSPNGLQAPRITSIKAFHKYSRSQGDIETADASGNVRVDYNEDQIKDYMEQYRCEVSDLFFTTRAAANKALQIQIDRDKKRLEAFNRDHGTNHVYPFEEGANGD